MANNILEQIEREYSLIRKRNLAITSSALNRARSNPRFSEIEREIKTLNFEIAKAEEFYNDEAKASELKISRAKLSEEKNALLHTMGINPHDLEKKYTCNTCKDTGFVNGKPCSCFNEKWKKYNFSALGIEPTASVSFADDTAKKTEKLEKTYSALKKFVEKFPNTNTRNFLFMGKTGCGKTFLASAVATELSNKGFNSIFLTATSLNQLFLKMHLSSFSERVDYMSMLINCDFLVIDDLGAENTYKNVTHECLLALISERLAKRKHTIITTNLTQDEILERYNERLFSRITEKNSSVTILFEDFNFRKEKI